MPSNAEIQARPAGKMFFADIQSNSTVTVAATLLTSITFNSEWVLSSVRCGPDDYAAARVVKIEVMDTTLGVVLATLFDSGTTGVDNLVYQPTTAGGTVAAAAGGGKAFEGPWPSTFVLRCTVVTGAVASEKQTIRVVARIYEGGLPTVSGLPLVTNSVTSTTLRTYG